VDERGAVRVGGQTAHPGDTERLHEYWVHGPGAAKVAWGTPGDFDRCVMHLGKFIKDPQGYCNLAHHAALGYYPATHAAMEKKAAGRADMATTTKAPYGTGVDYGDPGYLDADGNQASKSGKPGVKRYPLSADKVMAAWSYINQAKNAGQYTPAQLSAIKGRIKSAMSKHGHDTADSSNESASRMELFRSYPLEEAHVVTRAEGDGSGRLVEAYCAVFDEPAEIMDHQGHYREDIDRTAFNKRIADVQRSRSGFGLVKCIYNHGMTLHGTPAERFSLPPAVCKHISAESRGVLTRSYYLDTPLGNELLEMWREGAISAQSFTGAIIRSSPELRRGEKYRPRDGQLPRVTRLELGLKEYGGTPFPAYTGAELVGVRMSPLGTWQAAEGDETEDEALPPDGEAAADEPPPLEGKALERHHQHALYALRSRERREAAGLVW
jgi:phage head maturation protease